MALEDDIAQSREHEMRTYLKSMQAMYDNALAQNGEIYDIAFELTDAFTKISKKAILEDSRIIKILRYAVAPSISQMKFGQLFGLSSTERFEADKVTKQSSRYQELAKFAVKIARFTTDHLDRTRFLWLRDATLQTSLATTYAKNWTCSIAADQNAQTAYRNWRKTVQEHALIDKLVALGYTKSSFTGTIQKQTDINLGEFTQEAKIKGRTIQKADATFRSKASKKLVLIEAKAVGVEIDATKRIKECCDKANDWRTNQQLQDPIVVAMIAGFFTPVNISNLAASQVTILWEHRLQDIEGIA